MINAKVFKQLFEECQDEIIRIEHGEHSDSDVSMQLKITQTKLSLLQVYKLHCINYELKQLSKILHSK